MACDGAVAAGLAGKVFNDVVRNGVSLVLPYELVADGGVEAGVIGIVDGQMQCDNAVALGNTMERASVVAAFSEYFVVPNIFVATGNGEFGFVSGIHDSRDAADGTLAVGGGIEGFCFENRSACYIG